MPASAPPPSARLVRAIAAERDELERHRARMTEEADELRRALARIEGGLADLDERRALLDRLAPRETPATSDGVAAGGGAATRGGVATSDGAAAGGGTGIAPADLPASPGAVRLLRGPEIREVAVRVMLEHGGEALHYREWFGLVVDAGHGIAGKDPLAVFLTQLGRSPAVRRASGAGIYELDRHAGARLRARLEHLQRDLRALTIDPGSDLRELRARRERLTAEIGRVERALEEIARVLGPAPPLAAAG